MKHTKHGKKCTSCGHMIYYNKRFGYRCGPGCDRATTTSK